MEIKFDSKHEGTILKLLNEAHKILNSTRGNPIRYEDIIYALAHLIQIEDDKKKIEHNRRKREFIRIAVENSKNYRKLSVKKFIKRLDIDINQFKNKPLKEFWIVFPSNIENNKAFINRRSFTLDGTKIYMRNYMQIQKNYDIKGMESALVTLQLIRDYLPPSTIYFVIKQRGRDIDETLRKANKKIQLFFSLLNYYKLQRKINIIIFQREFLPFKIAHPLKYAFILNEKKKYVTYAFTFEGKNLQNSFRLTNRDLTNITKLVKEYNAKKESDIKKLLINSLELYMTALQQTNPSMMFLNFWQILETIALKSEERNIRMDEVKKRFLSVIKTDEVMKIVTEEILQKRNKLVHLGDIDIDYQDINYIKIFSEAFIKFLWNITDQLYTESMLNHYFKLKNINDKDLMELGKVIKKLFSLRK